MPTNIPDREKARRLIGTVPGIDREGQARTLLTNAMKRIAALGSESETVGREAASSDPTPG
jgi:hypothetical protein